MIAHLDLDCFYAQVEQRRLGLGPLPYTSTESRPVAVQQPHGPVGSSTCFVFRWDGLIAVNYAARAAGVKLLGGAQPSPKRSGGACVWLMRRRHARTSSWSTWRRSARVVRTAHHDLLRFGHSRRLPTAFREPKNCLKP